MDQEDRIIPKNSQNALVWAAPLPRPPLMKGDQGKGACAAGATRMRIKKQARPSDSLSFQCSHEAFDNMFGLRIILHQVFDLTNGVMDRRMIPSPEMAADLL